MQAQRDLATVYLDRITEDDDIKRIYNLTKKCQFNSFPVVSDNFEEFKQYIDEGILFEVLLGERSYGMVAIERVLDGFDIISHFSSWNIGKRSLKLAVAITSIAMLREMGVRNIYGAIHENNAHARLFVKMLGFKKVDKVEKQKYIIYNGKPKLNYELWISRK